MPTIIGFFGSIILPAAVSGGVAWLAVGYLSKKLIEQKLAKELEGYKSQLTSKTEALKTNLSIFAHEQNIISSRIDTQSANAIHEAYGAIRAVINPAIQIINGSPIVNGTPDDYLGFYLENAEKSHDAARKLAQTLVNSAIYFDEETYELVSELSSKSSSAVATFLRPLRMGIGEGQSVGELLASVEVERPELTNDFSNNIFPLNRVLLDIFRKQLGTIRQST